ncbi:X protein [Potato yellow dwarf virus]|uniref:X protein n=2 Tax=Alphanucleorhabdovirus tuberosum TaxID=2749927 RepID=D5L200_9RHAB|nr:X protein [Potato yellow dwarf virus]ADE45269.1 X protein [Potato yellow dwarf virus]QYA72296.1 X protein [Alphanucleorhabdovirus tuberosum]
MESDSATPGQGKPAATDHKPPEPTPTTAADPTKQQETKESPDQHGKEEHTEEEKDSTIEWVYPDWDDNDSDIYDLLYECNHGEWGN